MATVWTLALLGVLMIAGLLAATVAVQAGARQRASTAADIAALAAAQSTGDPCTAGADAARANGATLVACVTDGLDVSVTVGYPAPELVQRFLGMVGVEARTIESSARAGPGQ